MEDNHREGIQIGSASLTLITSEFLSSSNPRYKLVRAQLLKGEEMITCLFGIDLVYLTVQHNQRAQEETAQLLRENIGDALVQLVLKDGFIANRLYYGTHLQDGSFEISTEKPDWEDGHWGTKIH